MKKTFMMIMIGAALVSCNHKDLDYEETDTNITEIIFDWSLAPDADPSSMSTFLFPDNAEPLRYEFDNAEGGDVRIPVGHYLGIAMNSDNTDWARFRDTDDVDRFEIHTDHVDRLPVSGLTPDNIPVEEGESVVKAPGMLWSTHRSDLTLTENDHNKVFIFYPREAVCHYTVDIYDVENLSSLSNNDLDATLSGMSGGYLHWKGRPSDSKVTIPMILSGDKTTNSLHGEFLTFGENPDYDFPHKLKVHALLDDGTTFHKTFEVTDQVKNAEDPTHVHIVIRGVQLPKQQTVPGGFRPDVNDWEDENIDLNM